MITIKCHYQNNDSIITRINGTLEDARNYFEGSIFNIGSAKDNLQKCIKVELIK